MITMEIRLQNNLKRRLEARAAESGFDTVEAYVRSLIQADAADKQVVDDQDLERLLLGRLKDSDSIEFNPEFVQTFKQEVARRRRTRKGRA